jgi:beta-N-acetylhexosaminidase
MSFSYRPLHPLFNALVAISLVLLWLAPSWQTQARAAVLTPREQAIELLERLTPEERVGQLFLVTFNGTDVGPESQIAALIDNHHVGGVILLAENDNFSYDPETPEDTTTQVIEINRQLQINKWEASRQPQPNPSTGEEFTPAYIPLFIGLSQEGDGYPYDQIMHGLTPLPNAMAMGATWDPELAAQVGEVLGKELVSLGVNLLLGPSLDVLETPQIEGASDLGTRTFGGDPFWVAQMGAAFISGVHTGGDGKIAVVAKHFPGHGGSDRLPEEEVATVRKSLEELENFDLVPFYSVTGDAVTPEEVTDALLVSHIRYQGLQGNIRATTRPVSFDPQAFNLLMQLPKLDSWRQSGGVMISDNLGSRAVRRFYSLTSQDFDARRVALNAFLAGNDLLYVADFSSESEPDSSIALTDTLAFFAQKYREDTAFSQRVDESVLRILTLKYKLYNNFILGTVTPSTADSPDLGNSSQVGFNVARQAATLISPTQAELDETIPDPPNQNDRIVIISDVRTAQQCSDCPPHALLDVNALSDAILQLYGPQAGGQVTTYNLASYTLDHLQAMLDQEEEGIDLEISLRRANWVVFAMLQNSTSLPSFQTLSRLLSERPDAIQQKRLIVFAFCAPYYLDATNISKLTAYYGLYSKTPQFIDVAAYLLFQELRPAGAPPVSVSGIGYDLNKAMFPDPAQIIPLEFDLPQPETPVEGITPEPPPPPEYRVGDVIPLRTGVIVDFNGNPVPDGTPVQFSFTISGETDSVAIQTGTTLDGISRTTFLVVNPGSLEISAESENARSQSLNLDIPAPNGEQVTPTATPTLEPTLTATPTEIPITPVPEITPPPETSERPGPGDWLIAVLIASAIGWVTYRLAILAGNVRWGVRAGFLALIGGLLAYTYVALHLPMSEYLIVGSAAGGVVFSSIAGALFGLLLAALWRALTTAEKQLSGEKKS